eukprot:gene2082-1954_t
MWLLNIILPFVLIYVVGELYQWWVRSKIVHVKTGKPIPASFSMWRSIFEIVYQRKSLSLISAEFQRDHPNGWDRIGSLFFLHFHNVMIVAPDLVQKVFADPDTFQKMDFPLGKYYKIFWGETHLVAANGHVWKKGRAIIDKSFYNLDNYCDVFREKAKVTLQAIEKMGRETDNIRDLTQRLALDVLGKCVFGHEFNSLLGQLDKYMEAYTDLTSNILTPQAALWNNLFSWFPFLPRNIKTEKNIEIMNELVHKLSNQTREKLKDPNYKRVSMLDNMIDSQSNSDPEKALTDTEIRDNVLAFFLAGHETTANNLAFIIYQLAYHQDVQAKVRKEIDEVLGDAEPNSQNIKSLQYLPCVIKEVLRMYTPISTVPPRLTSKDVVLDGYKIPKGYAVTIHIHSVHRSKEIYGDPDVFRPERWSKEGQEKFKVPRYGWIPFSGGSRVCIGNNFSLLEQNVFIINLLRNYNIEYTGDLKNICVEPEDGRPLLQEPKNHHIRFVPLKKVK